MSDHEHPDDKKSDQDKVFAQWLDGKLSSEQKEVFEQNIEESDDALWQQRMHTASYVAHQAQSIPDKNVPHWDRGAAFVSDKQSWWQWGGLPALSMACSVLAIALVLFKVELVVQPEGVLLSFAGSASSTQEEKVAALVDQKLKEFASEQQVVLANYAADIKVKQQDNNLQLASYILSTSRQERKEDMSDFIGYINEQRQDENLEQKIKFQQLERAIKYQKTTSDGLGATTRPANWTSEE